MMPVPTAAFSSPIESFVNDGRQSEAARLVQRGVGRLLAGHGFSVLYELPLASGRRADVTALGGNGDIAQLPITPRMVKDGRAVRWIEQLLKGVPPGLFERSVQR